jgi:hypothetical protein
MQVHPADLKGRLSYTIEMEDGAERKAPARRLHRRGSVWESSVVGTRSAVSSNLAVSQVMLITDG